MTNPFEHGPRSKEVRKYIFSANAIIFETMQEYDLTRQDAVEVVKIAERLSDGDIRDENGKGIYNCLHEIMMNSYRIGD